MPCVNGYWRNWCSLTLAAAWGRGDLEVAERTAREGLALTAPTDYEDIKAEAFVALADVLARAGKQKEATAALEQAVALFEQKGTSWPQNTRGRCSRLLSGRLALMSARRRANIRFVDSLLRLRPLEPDRVT